MIMCCRQRSVPLVGVRIESRNEFSDRKLEIAICRVCGALLAKLTQFNAKSGKYEIIRPKRKDTANFIKKLEQEKWEYIDNFKIKSGTKGNMGFVYGVNLQHKNGKIYQYAVDFNKEKKLVKVIDVLPSSLLPTGG